ncbi:MAG: hypothetical protein RMJ98_13525 [Myxococcales bacterium]|nr:hypothetical protein [Polyangiaceae bacterium]MDW8250310.1 hypothetical protein [Myxococcales bacterium]
MLCGDLHDVRVVFFGLLGGGPSSSFEQFAIIAIAPTANTNHQAHRARLTMTPRLASKVADGHWSCFMDFQCLTTIPQQPCP